MAAIKLINGRSYMYKGYVFRAGQITEVDKADVNYLMGTGHFELVGAAKEVSKEEPAEEAFVGFEEEEEPKVSPKKTARKPK